MKSLLKYLLGIILKISIYQKRIALIRVETSNYNVGRLFSIYKIMFIGKTMDTSWTNTPIFCI